MRLLALLACTYAVASQTPRRAVARHKAAPASGCGKPLPPGVRRGDASLHELEVTDGDSRLGNYSRSFVVHVPSDYVPGERLPLVFYFHGWGELVTRQGAEDSYKFHNVGESEKFITVQPRGMSDFRQRKDYGSWNCLDGGRTDICDPANTDAYQYDSCQKLGATGACNWATCYDDVKFVSDLAAHLASAYCVDEDNIFAAGDSAGGIFLFTLLAELKRRQLGPTFRAIAPAYGAFLEHMQAVPAGLEGTSVLALVGSKDRTIPPQGGAAPAPGYAWRYVPINDTLQAYADVNHCTGRGAHLETAARFSGEQFSGCVEWGGCGARRVLRCDWNHGHGFWTSYMEDMLWDFFRSVRYTAPAAVEVDSTGARVESTTAQRHHRARVESMTAQRRHRLDV